MLKCDISRLVQAILGTDHFQSVKVLRGDTRKMLNVEESERECSINSVIAPRGQTAFMLLTSASTVCFYRALQVVQSCSDTVLCIFAYTRHTRPSYGMESFP